MDINKILKSDYLDILFEGRNKTYGGYELRKKYPNRMRNAAIIGVSIMALAFASPVIAGLIKGKGDNKPAAMLQEVNLAEPPPIDPNKPPPPPPPPEPPPPVKPTVKFTPPVIEKDEKVKEDEKPPEQTELKDVSSGIKTQEGDPNGIDPGIVDQPGTGVVEAPKAPEIFSYVQQMPEFPGDIMKYLGEHIHYPEAARENAIEGRVTVKFVVNEDGSVSDIQVLRGIGGGCDEEAKRVVAGMPKWKPGKQNGRAVKVYYNLPIFFKLQ